MSYPESLLNEAISKYGLSSLELKALNERLVIDGIQELIEAEVLTVDDFIPNHAINAMYAIQSIQKLVAFLSNNQDARRLLKNKNLNVNSDFFIQLKTSVGKFAGYQMKSPEALNKIISEKLGQSSQREQPSTGFISQTCSRIYGLFHCSTDNNAERADSQPTPAPLPNYNS